MRKPAETSPTPASWCLSSYSGKSSALQPSAGLSQDCALRTNVHPAHHPSLDLDHLYDHVHLYKQAVRIFAKTEGCCPGQRSSSSSYKTTKKPFLPEAAKTSHQRSSWDPPARTSACPVPPASPPQHWAAPSSPLLHPKATPSPIRAPIWQAELHPGSKRSSQLMLSLFCSSHLMETWHNK